MVALTVLSVIIQAGLLPLYRRTPFSLGAWSFTFPFAAVATFLIVATPPLPLLAPIVAILGISAITVLVAAVAYRSLRLVVRSEPAAEHQLAAADDFAENAGHSARRSILTLLGSSSRASRVRLQKK